MTIMAKGRYVIGVDLGGTWTRVGLSDEKGNFIEKINEKIDTRSSEAISKQIVKLTRFLCKKHHVNIAVLRGIGIASAGPLVQARGVLINPTNLPFKRVLLTEPITDELTTPACLINDCVGAALGENMFGAAKDLDNHVYITISTGIGGGAIVNGTLLLGKDGNGHEVGHLTIDYEGRLRCGCGKRGHWEAYCSGRNIPNFVRMRFEEIDEKMVKRSLLFTKLKGDLSELSTAGLFAAAKAGDSLSLQLVNDIGILNAVGFADVVNAYDPTLITVGGTVALKNKKMILTPIRKHVKDHAVNRIPKITITPLGKDVVIYGAVAAALRYLP
jgi:glucokinase